jgi:hypothetical protein
MSFLEKILVSLSGDMSPTYCNVFLYGSFSILFVLITVIFSIFTQIISKKISLKANDKKVPHYTLYSFIGLLIGTLVPYLTNRVLYTMCKKSLA